MPITFNAFYTLPATSGIDPISNFAVHSFIDSIIGKKANPFSDRLYSTLGGNSLKASLFINPSSSSSFNCSVNTFRVMCGIMASNWPKRMVRVPITFIMIGFHLLPMVPIALVKGQFELQNLSSLILENLVVTQW